MRDDEDGYYCRNYYDAEAKKNLPSWSDFRFAL